MEFKGSRLELQPTPALGSSKNKMLHVVYRVGNMDRAIKFYQDVFGMEVKSIKYDTAAVSCFAYFCTEELLWRSRGWRGALVWQSQAVDGDRTEISCTRWAQ